MRPYEKQLLDERLKHFMREVIPEELLPYLPCLTEEDQQQILAKQTNHGHIRATSVLVDRLKRREKGFPQFVQALRSCGAEHTALLLDPYYKIKDDAADNESPNTDGTGLGYKMIGTAIDLEISGSLFSEDSEERTESCCVMEESVAETYRNQKSEQNKKMRKELQKHLPQGAVFVNTAKGSIISTFRLSSEKAAVELWEMYTKGTLESMLQTELVENTLKDHPEIPEELPKLAISLGVEKFNTVKEKLKEIETKQENESLFSLTSEEEKGIFDDDGCDIKIEIPPVFLGCDANALRGKELQLREYQKELAEPAIQGKNTIICAPTNSGKTYVAIGIVKEHLDSFSSNTGKPKASADITSRKQPRVVFIVSTVNLVSQQKEKFEEYLCDKYTVGEICGANATDIPLKYLLQSHHVVVMTAQILVNALNSENEERVELKDISMLLFDECHHADKGHPYNSIMENYLALKFQPGRQPCLPKIIGLTASLGTGKAKSVEKAEEHIILVSANLDAEVISTVQKEENKKEIKKYANVPDQGLYHVQKNGQDPFENIISKVMDQIEFQLKKKKGKCYKAGPPDKAGQQYRQWIEEFYKDSAAAGDRFLVTYAEHLREYHVALTLNTSTRMTNARRYLQKYFDSLDRKKFTEIDEKLEQLYKMATQALDRYIEQYGEPDNPLLAKLKQLLLQNYEDAETPRANEGKSTDKKDCGKNEGVGNKDGREDLANALNPGKAYDEGKRSSDKDASQKADDKAKVTQEQKSRGEEKLQGETARTTENAEKHSRETFEDKTKEENEEGGEDEDNGEAAKRARANCDLDAKDAGQDSTKMPSLETKEEDDLVKDASYEEDLVKRVDVRSGHHIEGAECTDEVKEVGGSEPDEKEYEEVNDRDGSKASGKNPHQAEWDGPKGILFTKTRESTEALLDWIKETKELNDVLRPEPLVGGGDVSIGMTQNEQEKVIKRFKTGEKNLLLATSVAEEGLDISDCNYVIRYNMMGNEISSVQSRGRVRADKGKYTVLVGQSGARKREKLTYFREILMTEALNKVQRMNPEKFILTVKDIQRKCYQDRYLKKTMFAVEKSEFLPKDVTFFCRKCKEEVCQAHDVCRIKGSHHVIINREVRDTKVDIKKHPRPKKVDGIDMNKKIFCKKCHEDWGVIALICNIEWMCVKVSSFVLEFPEKDRPRRMYKKWKDLPFAIKEASLAEAELLQRGTNNGEANGLLDVDLSLDL